MLTMLLISLALEPGLRYVVEVLLALADVCMPGVRLLLRVRVLRLDRVPVRILYLDTKVERLGGNGTAIVTSGSVENACEREAEAMKSSIAHTTVADSAPLSSTPWVFAAHSFSPFSSRYSLTTLPLLLV